MARTSPATLLAAPAQMFETWERDAAALRCDLARIPRFERLADV
ncbi:hypothetical protein ACFY78_17425 [Streptomyces olindensis]